MDIVRYASMQVQLATPLYQSNPLLLGMIIQLQRWLSKCHLLPKLKIFVFFLVHWINKNHKKTLADAEKDAKLLGDGGDSDGEWGNVAFTILQLTGTKLNI